VQRRFEAFGYEFMLHPSSPESPWWRAGYGEAIDISLVGPDESLEKAWIDAAVSYGDSDEDLENVTNYFWTLLSAALPEWGSSREWLAQALGELNDGQDVLITVGGWGVTLRCWGGGGDIAHLLLRVADSSEPLSTQQPVPTDPMYPQGFHEALGERWSQFVSGWQAPTVTPAPDLGPEAGKTQVSSVDGMVMLYVPAGEFLTGAAADDLEAELQERPQHTVYLSAYWIDRTEVTNEMFAQFLNAVGQSPAGLEAWFNPIAGGLPLEYEGGKWSPSSGYSENPVALVTWFSAQAYCGWAGRRLPTEAEWEKAARGTDGRVYPWGDSAPTCKLANFWGDLFGCVDGTSPVGMYPRGASPYGALDMAGNLLEWTNSQGFDYPYDPLDGREDTGIEQPRVIRGGWFRDDYAGLRTTARFSWFSRQSERFIGFRCAASP